MMALKQKTFYFQTVVSSKIRQISLRLHCHQ